MEQTETTVTNKKKSTKSVISQEKPKRKYTRKNIKIEETPIELTKGSQKPKRKYTRKNKIEPIVEPAKIEPKPKRKYTKKKLVIIEEPIVVESSQKLKRKYTRKNKKEIEKEIKTTEVVIQEPENIEMSNRWNEKFVNVLEEMEKLMMKKGEPFKARAYSNAKESILEIKHYDKSSYYYGPTFWGTQ